MTPVAANRRYRRELRWALIVMAGWASLTAAQTQQTQQPSKAERPTSVKATGENATAVGGNLTIDKNIEVHEYDADQARSRDASRFARSVHRECASYLPMIDELSLTGKSDGATVVQPGFMGPVYAMSDTRRLVGDAVYKTLNSQQAELKSLQGELLTLRMNHKMVAVHSMMDMQRGNKPQQPRAPGPTEEQFTKKKQEFAGKTRAHCDYLKSLM